MTGCDEHLTIQSRGHRSLSDFDLHHPARCPLSQALDPMQIRRSSFLTAICVALAILISSCVSFLWTQSHILLSATSMLTMSAESLARDHAHVARVDSLAQLRVLATSRLHSKEEVLGLVDSIVHNIEGGLEVLGLLLLLLFASLGPIIRELRSEESIR